MFSGWGIRTLSESQRGYNPVGYHLGSVWPHDNSIIAAGFKRYGFEDATLQIFNGIAQAAMRFPMFRLPELFAGFARQDYGVPVHYPVACHPQAWAAGTIPFLLSTLLGLKPQAFARRLDIVRPQLPEWVDWLEMRGLRVGQARLDLLFERKSERTVDVKVVKTEGRLDVIVEPEKPS
jgi:glycogen debranching enzyme